MARAPRNGAQLWEKVGITPRGIDRETSEMMHRTHMGVDNDWQSLLLQALRNALSDGWGGSMIATEVSDILFGVPTPRPTMVNVGVLKKDQVNIVVHGHNPVVSEMVSTGLPVHRKCWIWPKPRAPPASTWPASAARATNCSCAGASPWPATI